MAKFIYVAWVALMVAWLVINTIRAVQAGVFNAGIGFLVVLGFGLAIFALSLAVRHK